MSRRRIIRPPAVAGTFYPGDVTGLTAELRHSFAEAAPADTDDHVPKAIVVPHAGYVYSGPIAASAYARLAPAHDRIHRVVLLGPAHRVWVDGLALSSADAWETPLGLVPLDVDAARRLDALAYVTYDDRAHAPEHSLEVQVPFLQSVLDDFVLLPIVVGDATPEEVAGVLDEVWDDPATVVVISTDLSHYERYERARALDGRTAAAIAAGRAAEIGDRDACGARPLRGLLTVAADRGLAIEELDLRNSGDTAGDRDRVVGYGAFAVG